MIYSPYVVGLLCIAAFVIGFICATLDANRRIKQITKLTNVVIAEIMQKASHGAERNGVRRPSLDTVSANMWLLFDTKTAELGHHCELDDVLATAVAQGLNEGHTRTQHSRWRRYNGMVKPRKARKSNELMMEQETMSLDLPISETVPVTKSEGND